MKIMAGFGKIFVIIAILIVGVAVYVQQKSEELGFEPVPVTSPPVKEFEGVFALNNLLANATKVNRLPIHSPECIAVDSQGTMVVSSEKVGIIQVKMDGSIQPFSLYSHASRPLGIKFDSKDNLIVADAHLGLLSIDKITRKATILATETADGVPIRYANFVDVSKKTGKIYLSDSSKFAPLLRFPGGGYGTLEASILEAFSGAHSGRLIEYDPKTMTATTILKGLYFANGIALSDDESFLIVAETFNRRVLKFWLTGPRVGKTDVVVDGLPMYPDNISRGPNGEFYVALVSQRITLIEAMNPYPMLKKFAAFLPSKLQPRISAHCAVLVIDAKGSKVLKTLHNMSGEGVFSLTHALEHEGNLYFGTLASQYIYSMKK